MSFYIGTRVSSGATRPEVIQIANAPDWGTMWSWLPKSSAPALIYAVVRLWLLLGAGTQCEGMRLLGSLVSVG